MFFTYIYSLSNMLTRIKMYNIKNQRIQPSNHHIHRAVAPFSFLFFFFTRLTNQQSSNMILTPYLPTEYIYILIPGNKSQQEHNIFIKHIQLLCPSIPYKNNPHKNARQNTLSNQYVTFKSPLHLDHVGPSTYNHAKYMPMWNTLHEQLK